MAKESRSKSALGSKKSPKVSKAVSAAIKKAVRKEVHRMHIGKTANGKFLVDHEFKSAEGEPTIPGESHAINPEELAAHVSDNFGLGAGGPGVPAGPELMAPAPGPEAVPSAPAGPSPTGPIGV